MESGWERDVKVHKGWDLYLCGGSGGGLAVGLVVVVALIVAMGVMWGGGVDGSGGNSGVGDGGESGVYRSGEGGGSVVHRSVGCGLCRSG